MSIGKFFILAILLPIATIYLTLALKGHNADVVDDEVQPYVDIENYSSVDDYSTDNNEQHEDSEFSLNDDFVETRKASQINPVNDSFDSIESMITAKKQKKKNVNKPISNQNFNSLNDADDSIENEIKAETKTIKQEVTKSNITPNTNNLNTTAVIIKTPKTVNTTKSKKPPKSKTVVTKSTKNKSPTTRVVKKPKVKPRVKKTRVVKSNRKAKVIEPVVVKGPKPKITGSNRRTTRKVAKPTTKNQVVFKKQTIPKKTRSKKQNVSTSKRTNDNFGDLFDEGENIDVLEIEPQETEVVQNEDLVEEDEKPKRFTTNPCTGRSARYIARCRKK